MIIAHSDVADFREPAVGPSPTRNAAHEAHCSKRDEQDEWFSKSCFHNHFAILNAKMDALVDLYSKMVKEKLRRQHAERAP
jgi:hypothetical protein